MAKPSRPRSHRMRRPVIVLAASILFVWLAFFDSHSFYRRVSWWYDRAELRSENQDLEVKISELEASIDRGLSADDVERIAREQYGMRRPGETIYPEQLVP